MFFFQRQFRYVSFLVCGSRFFRGLPSHGKTLDLSRFICGLNIDSVAFGNNYNARCVNRKIVKIKQNKQMTLKKPRLGRTSLQPMIDAKIVYDIK